MPAHAREGELTPPLARHEALPAEGLHLRVGEAGENGNEVPARAAADRAAPPRRAEEVAHPSATRTAPSACLPGARPLPRSRPRRRGLLAPRRRPSVFRTAAASRRALAAWSVAASAPASGRGGVWPNCTCTSEELLFGKKYQKGPGSAGAEHAAPLLRLGREAPAAPAAPTGRRVGAGPRRARPAGPRVPGGPGAGGGGDRDDPAAGRLAPARPRRRGAQVRGAPQRLALRPGHHHAQPGPPRDDRRAGGSLPRPGASRPTRPRRTQSRFNPPPNTPTPHG